MTEIERHFLATGRPKLMLAALFTFTLTACTTPFDLQGHRGARGHFPENSLPAFAFALDQGVTTLELDTGISKDGVVIVAHDPRLNVDFTRDRQGNWITTQTSAALRSLTAAELQQFDVGRIRPESAYAKRFPNQRPLDGTRMPRLTEVFDWVKSRGDTTTRFNIETKLDPRRPDDTVNPETFVTLLVQTIRAAGMGERTTIQSFDWRTLRLVQALAPEMGTVYLTAEQSWLNNVARDSPWTAGLARERYPSVPAMVHAAGGKTWSPYFGDLTDDQLFAARQLGLRVVPWTVNEVKDMRRLLAMKVDGLITDYPDRAQALLADYGLRSRP
jgi:glycerophosphoryl diester phosphodiesterase